MSSIRNILESTVSISLFNRGMAGKIFEEVKRYGTKIVMKNNIPECVLISPDEYIRLVDAVNDAKLLSLAIKRTKNVNPDLLVSQEEFDKKFGFVSSDYEDDKDIEFE